MTAKFTFKVQVQTSGDGEFLMDRSRFGDGYSQDTPKGINNEVQKWKVSFAGYKGDCAPVMAFLRSQKGLSFLWTPPLGVEGYYTCTKYGISDNGGAFFTISMDFEQGYVP